MAINCLFAGETKKSDRLGNFNNQYYNIQPRYIY